MFYVNRQGELKESILKNKISFFYSPFCTGKTEFIKNELLIDNNMIYIDLSYTFTLKDLTNALIKETAIFFNKNVSKLEIYEDEINLFKTALVYPIYESEDKNYKDLILCFDNFNYISNFLKDKELKEVFKIFSDVLLKSDIKMLFTFNNSDGKDIFYNPNSQLFSFAVEIPFLKLEKEEILKTVNEYLSDFNISLNNSNLELITSYFGLNMRYLKYLIKELIIIKAIDEHIIKECINKVYKIVKYDIKEELKYLIGKKSFSDLLYYVANDMNIYSEAMEHNSLSKHNAKHTLNILEKIGLIVQEKKYGKYICRDNILKRYILENFNKKVIK